MYLFGFNKPAPAVSISPSPTATANKVVSKDIQEMLDKPPSTIVQFIQKKLESQKFTLKQAQDYVADQYSHSNMFNVEACLRCFPNMSLEFAHGAEPTKQFVEAALKGCVLFVIKALKSRPDLINATCKIETAIFKLGKPDQEMFERPFSALSAAAYGGQLLIVEMLLKGEFNLIDAKIALYVATRRGHTQVVEALCRAGVRP